ncbi:MAG TPA: phosphoribosylformylglycinamidine synthase subunit PurS [Gemmatimonadales bacterium]|jgi:phosphoribosylformylglycinamidine synthase|nr:phosphoribosylformylglycinamidine synthase subunit PurS [Gemmatimonadales bacterium]
MTWRVHVRILPRTGLLDPQGQAVEHALAALAFPEVSNVHVGKAIALDVAASSAAEAEARVRTMCDRLLANPVTEDYEIDIEPGGAA